MSGANVAEYSAPTTVEIPNQKMAGTSLRITVARNIPLKATSKF